MDPGTSASRRVAAAPVSPRPARQVVSRVLPKGAWAGPGSARESGAAEFLLFLLLNAVVIIRPADFVSAVQGLPIYQAVIILCCLASARSLFQL